MKTGSHQNAEARMRMSEAHKAVKQIPWNKGKQMSTKARAKMRAAKEGRVGHPQTAETREKIRAAMQGKQHALGVIRTSETRAKMAAYQLGRRGSLSHNWKGGRKKMVAGYIRAFAPDHPFADPKGYVLEHRLIAEKVLGRYLKPAEMIHHFNAQKDDNRNQNLVICQDDKYHKLLHSRTKCLFRKET